MNRVLHPTQQHVATSELLGEPDVLGSLRQVAILVAGRLQGVSYPHLTMPTTDAECVSLDGRNMSTTITSHLRERERTGRVRATR